MYACGMTVCLHESTRPWTAGSGPWVVYQKEGIHRDTKTRSMSIVIKLTEIQELFDGQRWWREPGVVLYFGVVVFQESEEEPHLEKLMPVDVCGRKEKKEKRDPNHPTDPPPPHPTTTTTITTTRLGSCLLVHIGEPRVGTRGSRVKWRNESTG